MAYKVTRVFNTRTLNDFFALPYKIYKDDKNWIPPIKSELKRILNSDKNPYFKQASLTLFNCYDNTGICSRMAVIINSAHEKKYNVRSAYFGFFESYNDLTAVRSLLKEVITYCKKFNVEILEGPFNPNHYSELGLLMDKYDEFPSYFQVYNPEYYKDLLTASGFQISEIFHTRKNPDFKKFVENNFGNDLCLEHNGLKVTKFDMRHKETELENLRSVFNDAFSDNWHFLAVSKEEYLFSAKYLNLVTLPEHICFVEYNGEPVGAVHCVLDINPLLKEFNGHFNPVKYIKLLQQRREIGKLIVFAVGIKKSFRNSKVFQLLLNAFILSARNYDILETTWMSHKNLPSIKVAELLGLKPDKQFAIYSKSID